ncbi:hypothetical protein QBC36DRAFT_357510 [Triangularia setosa]|uniref:Uncharacterized protein n=1 Tax=Triangularia setosa TaxID=2587417 RepID=A0AAN6WEG0_9PEZI|nr:hypothetical protein QBC36DRAFT_357510 [Podospora setosa]
MMFWAEQMNPGMFLYAKLMMENLEAQPSLASLWEKLERFPQGLDQAHEEADRLSWTSDGYCAFQDYAAAHWADHVFGAFSLNNSVSVSDGRAMNDNNPDLAIKTGMLVFASSFNHDGALSKPLLPEEQKPVVTNLAGFDEFKSDPIFPHIRDILWHIKCPRTFVEDKRDKASVLSNQNGLEKS